MHLKDMDTDEGDLFIQIICQHDFITSSRRVYSYKCNWSHSNNQILLLNDIYLN